MVSKFISIIRQFMAGYEDEKPERFFCTSWCFFGTDMSTIEIMYPSGKSLFKCLRVVHVSPPIHHVSRTKRDSFPPSHLREDPLLHSRNKDCTYVPPRKIRCKEITGAERDNYESTPEKNPYNFIIKNYLTFQQHLIKNISLMMEFSSMKKFWKRINFLKKTEIKKK